jgi:hypothetical protein
LKTIRRFSTLLLILSCHAYQTALGWGVYGHEVVASIAERLIQPGTKREVRAILGESRTLAGVSNWADRVANKDRATSRWHYVNIPKRFDEYEPERDCPKAGCLVSALMHFLEVLSDKSALPEEREEALKFVVHLVGDLHQPLHCGYREDRGGNWVQVRFFRRGSNLHKVWDVDLLAKNEMGFNELVEKLVKRVVPEDSLVTAKGTLLDWVYESRNLLRDHVYDFDSDRKLGQEYYSKNIVIVDRQLLNAGVRLASLLDNALR